MGTAEESDRRLPTNALPTLGLGDIILSLDLISVHLRFRPRMPMNGHSHIYHILALVFIVTELSSLIIEEPAN